MDKIPKLLLLLCVLSSGMLYAQSGKVEIIEDPFVSQEIQRRIETTDTAQIPGFRIQIYFGSDMYKAEEVKEQFSADFPEYASQVYRKYERPYWKIRVGNFYREIDAQPLLKALETQYESVFIVKDNIALPPLKMEER